MNRKIPKPTSKFYLMKDLSTETIKAEKRIKL